MSMVWVIQHTPCETLGTIADALATSQLSAHYIRPFAGEPIPTRLDGAAGLIVMGGPMGVYEQACYPFLVDEMRLPKQALRTEKPVLGVCLGSQLLAATLGAPVTKGTSKEIGWHPVSLTEAARMDPLWTGVEPSFVAYHWHGDIFALPRGAVSLASSAMTACQAFRYGAHAYGVLFHLEVTEQIIAAMLTSFAAELQETRVDGREIARRASQMLPRLHAIGGSVFRRWAGFVDPPGSQKASILACL